MGLSTRRQYVLVVHPNPKAFVSVQLFIEDESATVGNHTLSTTHGDQSRSIGDEELRAEGFSAFRGELQPAASYSFEDVLLPPRPPEEGSPNHWD